MLGLKEWILMKIKIVFKQLSKENSLTSSILVTFKLFPESLNGKIVSLYTIVLFTIVLCGTNGTLW